MSSAYIFAAVIVSSVADNVTACQGAGTGTVNISYDVSDAEQSSVDIGFQCWDSSGS